MFKVEWSLWETENFSIASIRPVRLRVFDGMVCTLTNVFHVSDIKKCLILLGISDNNGRRGRGP